MVTLRSVKVIEQLTTEPVTLAEAKLQCRLITSITDTSAHPDDDLIKGMIAASREFAEHFTGRSIAVKTLERALDLFPSGGIELPGIPVTSVVSVKYLDPDGVERTLSSADYWLDDYGLTASLEPGTRWPAALVRKHAVKVRYVAGYADVPRAVACAMLLIIAHLYENRQEGTPFKVEQIPMGAQSFLNTLDTMAI